jgi:peptidoglycan/xylan/chitin deacetylase (PgdA/CDA1 family)
MFRACLALILAGCSAFAADIILPLPNSGFEEGMAGWISSAPEAAQSLSEAASIGKMGLRVDVAASPFTLNSSPVPVKPGESYAVVFWAGSPAASPAKVLVEMIFKDAGGTALKPETAKIRKWPSLERGGGRFFGKSVLAAKAPVGAVNLTIAIRPVKGASAGILWMDDFCIKELGDSVPQPRGPDGAAPIPPFDSEQIDFLENEIAGNPYREKSPPKIVLKFDDLGPRNGTVHARWMEVAEWARKRNIIVTMGIIAKGMEEDCPAFVQWVKDRHAEGRIEFWNHGWDHAQWKNAEGMEVREFSGSGYEHQKKHFAETQRIAREKLGFPFASFGAGFNATDRDTVRVLAEDPDTKVWIYGDAAADSGKTVLQRCYEVSVESPTLIPNYADFLEGYAHNRGTDYFVLQGHPMGWNNERWDQCNKIVDFLISQKAEFVKFTDLAK